MEKRSTSFEHTWIFVMKYLPLETCCLLSVWTWSCLKLSWIFRHTRVGIERYVSINLFSISQWKQYYLLWCTCIQLTPFTRIYEKRCLKLVYKKWKQKLYCNLFTQETKNVFNHHMSIVLSECKTCIPITLSMQVCFEYRRV